MLLDINKITENLYQGSWPPEGNLLAEKGFNVLVLAAQENQRADMYPGIEVMLAPGIDVPNMEMLLSKWVPIWMPAGLKVAEHVRSGRKVLVTCRGGFNRSGFISAVALHHLKGWSGNNCVERVQSRRSGALCNEVFIDYLIDNL